MLDVNGRLLANEALMGFNNRGFNYGDGLFETIRISSGDPLFLNYHLDRLKKGMRALSIDIPEEWSEPFWKNKIDCLLKNQELKGTAYRCKLTVFRDAPGFYAPEDNKPAYLLRVEPLDADLYQVDKYGVRIEVFEGLKKNINPLANLKTLNALLYVLAGVHKIKENIDDCVIMNDLGNISESISSNIFVVFNGVFYTPSLNQGCVEGVMRKVLIEILKEKGFEIQECPLGLGTLIRADEILLTNTIQGLKWVRQYKSKSYNNELYNKVLTILNERITK